MEPYGMGTGMGMAAVADTGLNGMSWNGMARQGTTTLTSPRLLSLVSTKPLPSQGE